MLPVVIACLMCQSWSLTWGDFYSLAAFVEEDPTKAAATVFLQTGISIEGTCHESEAPLQLTTSTKMLALVVGVVLLSQVPFF